MAIRQCTATTKKGQRCAIKVNLRKTPDGFRCIHHDPQRTEQVREMRRKGGIKATSRGRTTADVPSAPESIDDVVRWSAWVAVAVATGKIDSRVAREVTNAIRQFQSGIEKRDLQVEMNELRQQIKSMKKRSA